MPGLTLRITCSAGDNRDACEAQTLLLHSSHYRVNSAVERPGLQLGWVAYDGYPVRVFSSSGYLIYMEGRVYNRPAHSVDADLAALASAALAQEDDTVVERFLLANEGSYVVAVLRPETGESLIFSDAFGRLPLYYGVDESSLVVAREAKFVHALRPAPAFDRVGCAQVLAFGLPLGDRTVLEDVKSFPDAGLLRVRVVPQRLNWCLRRLHTWNLDEEDHSRSVTRHAGEFADLFLTACRSWGSHADSRGNLVSLSGGHDSRAVAAGLQRSGTAVVTVTYRDPNGRREREVQYARQLTRALGVEWHCIDLSPPPESAHEELAWLKDGMNVSSMGYILCYLQEIVRRWGRDWTYMSGDGGDDCLKVTAPTLRFTGLDDVVRYILEKETYIRPDHAEAMLRLPAGTLHEEMRRLFDSYPEVDLARRIKHFKIFERGRRCYFEGEDRTRSFLWEDSPFYSLSVFSHCMRVPDRLKRYKIFCRQALLALSPAAAATPVTPAGHAPASWKYIVSHWARESVLDLWAKESVFDLPSPLAKLTRRLTGIVPEPPFVIPGPFAAYLGDQLSRATPLAALLDGEHVRRNLREMNAHSFDCFWTVAMLEKAYRSRTGQAVRLIEPGA